MLCVPDGMMERAGRATIFSDDFSPGIWEDVFFLPAHLLFPLPLLAFTFLRCNSGLLFLPLQTHTCIGTRVITVRTRDQERDSITYGIEPSLFFDGSKFFTINARTGDVFLRESLSGQVCLLLHCHNLRVCLGPVLTDSRAFLPSGRQRLLPPGHRF